MPHRAHESFAQPERPGLFYRAQCFFRAVRVEFPFRRHVVGRRPNVEHYGDIAQRYRDLTDARFEVFGQVALYVSSVDSKSRMSGWLES